MHQPFSLGKQLHSSTAYPTFSSIFKLDEGYSEDPLTPDNSISENTISDELREQRHSIREWLLSQPTSIRAGTDTTWNSKSVRDLAESS